MELSHREGSGISGSHQEGGERSKLPPYLSALDTLTLETMCAVAKGYGLEEPNRAGSFPETGAEQ